MSIIACERPRAKSKWGWMTSSCNSSGNWQANSPRKTSGKRTAEPRYLRQEDLMEPRYDTLFYDGQCPLCAREVQALRRWLTCPAR